MNLICKINGKVYDKNIAQGLTISEEYNETLDSGAIILTHVNQIVDLKPYDDVWIYEKPEKSIKGQFDYVTVKNEEKNDPTHRKRFYRHFLVDNYSEKILNLEGGIYEYTIELFSETKLLEKIICPSTCVTEPLDIADKHDIEWYLDKYIDLYSPEIKRKRTDISGNYWVYDKKYKIAESLREKVRGKYPQDFQLTNPTLREILTQLLLTQDLIPIVKDDVIDALDITKRNGLFHNYDIDDIDSIDEIKEYVNSITGSMSSDNYTDSLRKTYTEAISQECLSSNIERIGFRNKDSALLTLSNLQIETRFPIYSIEQALLCYYKRLKFIKDGSTYYKDVLCKQDITPFILLNSARNVLSKDWSELEIKKDVTDLTIKEITKFRLYTLGYDIGSNVITGWGEMYSYPKAEGYDVTLTYIQNILYYLERTNPFGINLGNVITELYNDKCEDVVFVDYVKKENPFNVIPNIWENSENLIWTTDVGTKIKSMFVELKYKGFYKGTVITSKDGGRDYIQTSDNSNSSLTLLEKDGLSQKEKINRFGNKTMVFTARYPGDRYDLVQPLGCVYNSDNDKDIIIYHKEMAFYDNAITCTYYGARDYVLKNFYTSVRAKLRLNRLMSFEESVRRCENEKIEVLFSKDKLYYENKEQNDLLEQINTAFKPTDIINDAYSEKTYLAKNIIDVGLMTLIENDKEKDSYLTDINKSVNGKSIVFNLSMYDNVSPGVYIKEIKPKFNYGLTAGYKLFQEASDEANMTVGMYKAVSNYTDLTGSTQEWYKLTDDNGEIEEIKFSICHFEQNGILEMTNNYLLSQWNDLNKETIKNYTKSFLLPSLSDGSIFKNYWSKIINKKDNKEILDQTFQIEYCMDEKDDVFIGQNYLLLNDMCSNKIKELENELNTIKEGVIESDIYAGTVAIPIESSNKKYAPYFDIILGHKTYLERYYNKYGKNIKLTNVILDKATFGELDYSRLPGEGPFFYFNYTDAKGDAPIVMNNSNSNDNKKYYINKIEIRGSIDVDINIEKQEGEPISPEIIMYIPCRVYYKWFYKSDVAETDKTNNFFTDRILKLTLKDVVYMEDGRILLKTGYGFDSLEGYLGLDDIELSTGYDTKDFHPIDYDCFNLLDVKFNEDKTAIIHKGYSSYYDDEVNSQPWELNIIGFKGFNLKLIKEFERIKNMFVVYSPNPCTKTTEYEQYKPKYVDEDGNEIDDFKNAGYHIKDNLKVSDVFNLNNDNKIIVNKKDLTVKVTGEDGKTRYNVDKVLNKEIKSIQYWYYDNSTHSYKFVFGINLTEGTTEEVVYFSVVKNKDTRVFDENGEVVGHIHNFSGESNFAQKFDGIETLQTENNIV